VKIIGGRGLVSADKARAQSAPVSLLTQTTAGASSVSYANMGRDFGSTNRIRIGVDVLSTPPVGNVGDSVITVSFGGGAYFDFVWFTDGNLTVTERRPSAPNVDHPSSQKIPAGTWVRVDIDVTPSHLVVKVGGQPAIDTATQAYSGIATLTLGIYSEDTFAVAWNYDNVIVDTVF
jgi:hypothetical protein